MCEKQIRNSNNIRRRLQTEIATSTMHAEYISLSTGMRELIAIKGLTDELCEHLNIIRDQETKITKVHEDNEPALKLANSPLQRHTPQSKHFAIKYHWFREKMEDLAIKIQHVGTRLQKADILTKGLQGNEFRNKRKLVVGW